MASHEQYSYENEWYTPYYIFSSLGVHFDMDITAAPAGNGYVPASNFIYDAFNTDWNGFVWCNPPWAGRNKKTPWIEKMITHGSGILLTPDRTSAKWWQLAANNCTSLLFLHRKIKFIPGEGNIKSGKQPSTGTTLFSFGAQGNHALITGSKNNLGILLNVIKP